MRTPRDTVPLSPTWHWSDAYAGRDNTYLPLSDPPESRAYICPRRAARPTLPLPVAGERQAA